MKIFLSALEASDEIKNVQELGHMHYNLVSYYYGRQKEERTLSIIKNSELIMVDSGAHSFQKGTKVDWENYTEEYSDWIRKHDRKNIVGYFEMDVDNVLGYERVKTLRAVLERASDKIIPVWHKNRGIEDFQRMCSEYSGRVVAISGFKNEDIQDSQYLMFLKYAWQKNCRVHCLGMTRKNVLDRVPFDYVDSSSWKQGVLYGRIGNRKLKNAGTVEERRIMRTKQLKASYLKAMEMQEHYEEKWAATTRKMKERLWNE